MGNLPTDHVSANHVFESVSADFAGPIFNKESHLSESRLSEIYENLFISMNCKAINVKLVLNLSHFCGVASECRSKITNEEL